MKRRARGLAAVEMALVVPMFVFLLMATEELGRALYEYNTLTKAVRDGAQYVGRFCVAAGIVTLASCDVDNAKNLVVYGNLDGSGSELLDGFDTDDVTITPTTIAPATVPTYVTVTASYTFQPLFAVIPGGFGNTDPGTFIATIVMPAVGGE